MTAIFNPVDYAIVNVEKLLSSNVIPLYDYIDDNKPITMGFFMFEGHLRVMKSKMAAINIISLCD